MGKALFEISPEKCTMCYSCVRECPVKAIEIKSDRDYAKILPNRCIGCGGCLLVCPEDAVSFRSSKEEVKALLDSKDVVVAIVAPSVSGEFEDITDYRKFVQMLHVMGFNYVNEVSFGADLIAKQYKELFANFKGKHYLTSNCPVVLNDIEKYHPELIDNLAPIASPMILMNAIVRERYKKENIKKTDQAKYYNLL